MIELGDLRISLDRKEIGSDMDFISHAHSDHISAAKSSSSILASKETAELMECAYGLKVSPIELPENIKLIEAGHMLGSRQLCVDDPSSGKRIVYTGDFQLERSKTSKPITIVDADSLIIDSTYFEPSFNFGPKAGSENAIIEWTKRMTDNGIVLFSAYKMGKAQELISIFNQHGIVPIVSRRISELNKVYERNNVRLSYLAAHEHQMANECAEAVSGNFVGITETRDLGRLSYVLSKIHGKKVYTAMATGFAKTINFSTTTQFALSDHADFSQSLAYIEATGATNIYSYGQNSIEFALNLKREGYNAMPLPTVMFRNDQ